MEEGVVLVEEFLEKGLKLSLRKSGGASKLPRNGMGFTGAAGPL
jgi:hypothetical protein